MQPVRSGSTEEIIVSVGLSVIFVFSAVDKPMAIIVPVFCLLCGKHPLFLKGN